MGKAGKFGYFQLITFSGVSYIFIYLFIYFYFFAKSVFQPILACTSNCWLLYLFLCFLIPKPYPRFLLRMETYIYMQVAWAFLYARLRLWSKTNSYTVFLLGLQTLHFPEYLYYCLGKKGYVFSTYHISHDNYNHVWVSIIMPLTAFNIDFSHLLIWCINKMKIK